MLKLTAADYRTLYDIVFRDDYPGYKPHIVESPNGDGVKDTQKRYAHIAEKYIDMNNTYQGVSDGILYSFLDKCHLAALDTAVLLGVPRAFWPDIRYSAIRVLEYPAGATSALHTDFALFTLNLYRNVVNEGLLDTDVHFGEILSELGLGRAMPHSVEPDFRTQYSIVYFAMPDRAAILPSGQSVGDWVDERISRSRYEVS